MHTHPHRHTQSHTYVHLYIQLDTHMYIHAHTYRYTHVYTDRHRHIHSHIHTIKVVTIVYLITDCFNFTYQALTPHCSTVSSLKVNPLMIQGLHTNIYYSIPNRHISTRLATYAHEYSIIITLR